MCDATTAAAGTVLPRTETDPGDAAVGRTVLTEQLGKGCCGGGVGCGIDEAWEYWAGDPEVMEAMYGDGGDTTGAGMLPYDRWGHEHMREDRGAVSQLLDDQVRAGGRGGSKGGGRYNNDPRSVTGFRFGRGNPDHFEGWEAPIGYRMPDGRRVGVYRGRPTILPDLECPGCGETFHPKNHTVRHCSRACYLKARPRGPGSLWWRGKVEPRPCAYARCGAVFQPDRGRAQYCSRRCYQDDRAGQDNRLGEGVRLMEAGVGPYDSMVRPVLTRMWGRGVPSVEIGLALGVNHTTVLRWARILGLPARSPGPLPRPGKRGRAVGGDGIGEGGEDGHHHDQDHDQDHDHDPDIAGGHTYTPLSPRDAKVRGSDGGLLPWLAEEVCKGCGVDFIYRKRECAKGRPRRYCNRACFLVNGPHAERAARYRVKANLPDSQPCKECGSPYRPRYVGHDYCSRPCAGLAGIRAKEELARKRLEELASTPAGRDRARADYVLADMWAMGETRAAIAGVLGLSEDQVRRRVRKLGLPKRPVGNHSRKKG